MDDIKESYRTSPRNYDKPVRRLPVNLWPSTTVQQPVPATNPLPAPTQPQLRPDKKRLAKAAVPLLAVALALVGAGVYAYPRYISKNPFPANIQTNAQVSLLYPTKLPAGYSVDLSRIQMSNGVLLYAASDGSQRLVFTIQQRPASFDFGGFYRQQLRNGSQVQTRYGTATVGQNSGHFLASLVDGNTWMLVSTTDTHLTQKDFSNILRNLKQY